MNDSVDLKRQQWKSRLILLLIVALFFSSFGIAALLRFSGWQPEHTKNFGKLINPPIDLSAEQFKRLDGSAYDWNPELNRWRLVFVSDKPCLTSCQAMMDTLHNVWLSQGRYTEEIDLLWFAALPENNHDFKGFVPMRKQTALTKVLPELESSMGYPVYIIDPSGFVILQYPAADFDPSGLRKDLAKLVK